MVPFVFVWPTLPVHQLLVRLPLSLP